MILWENFIKTMLKIGLIFFLIVVFLITIKIVLNYLKYGKSIFKEFKKNSRVSNDEFLSHILNRIKCYKKIVRLEKGYICISEKFLIYIYYINTKNNIYINNNEVILEKSKFNKTKEHLFHIEIDNLIKIILINDNVVVNAKNLSDYELIRFSHLDNRLKKLQNDEKKYTTNKIDEIYKEVSDMYGNYKN